MKKDVKKKGNKRAYEPKILLIFVFFYYYFALVFFFLGVRYTYIFLRLSNGKAPLIKIIIVKVLLMLIFLTNVFYQIILRELRLLKRD